MAKLILFSKIKLKKREYLNIKSYKLILQISFEVLTLHQKS